MIKPSQSRSSVPATNRVIVRFGATLIANLVRAALSFVSGIMIARGLGAAGYGDLNFLLGSFAAISQLLDLGTSSAFYTFISQRRRSLSFALIYSGWMAFQFGFTLVVIAIVLPGKVVDRVWLGHHRGAILLAFASSFLMTQLWGMVSQLGEATRKTVTIQVAAVIQAVVHLVLVGLAMRQGWLTIATIMWLLVAEYLVLAIVLGPKLLGANLLEKTDARDGVRNLLRDFAVYCAPLVLYGWFGFLYTFADRWLLQRFGGAEQQGFFAIGQQVANISLIATTSILKVFWKEVAEARERKDNQRVRQLFASVSRSLYFVGAAISCLFIPFSREILALTLGVGYIGAWVCLAIMFLYPIHQALGQIQGTFFYASGDTKTYTKIGFLTMAVSIPVTYFVLAPRSETVPGLGLGAVGLAIKLVVMQIGAVNLQGYVIAHTNEWKFDYSYQAIVLIILLSVGWACKWMSTTLLGPFGLAANPIAPMFLGGLLYVGLVGALLYLRPDIAGIEGAQGRLFLNDLRRSLRLKVPTEDGSTHTLQAP